MSFSKPRFSYIIHDCIRIVLQYHIQSLEEDFMRGASGEEMEFIRLFMSSLKFERRRCSDSAEKISTKRAVLCPRKHSKSHFSILLCKFLKELGAGQTKILFHVDVSDCGDSVCDHTFSFFRGCRSVVMDNANGRISAEAFKNMGSVSELSMKNCRQRTIGLDCFKSLKSLQVLDMGGCYQSTINDSCLDILSGLRELRIDGCIQKTLTTKGLKGLKNLRVLSMAYCSQETIHVCDLGEMKELQFLDMSYCDPRLSKSIRRLLPLTTIVTSEPTTRSRSISDHICWTDKALLPLLKRRRVSMI
uniref:Uncharacterized protein n=1 Tax=Percolomonas cosmopolitus TaxID=63605 RepID=A0A7S1KSQ7_9EUKA